MKNVVLILLLSTFVGYVNAQNNEAHAPDNLPQGLYYQAGPGEANTPAWAYPYGTKIIANAGNNRNFELLIDTYPSGKLLYRQWKPQANSWHTWMRILSEDENGNVGVGTASPTDRLNIEVGTNKRIGINHVSSSAVTDFLVGAASIQFSRPSDGINGLHGIFSYDSSLGNNNLAVATRGDLVFATGGVGVFTGSPESMRLRDNGNLLIGKSIQANSTFKLDVNGKVRANEVVVNSSGADFVFEEGYQPMNLENLEGFIKTNKHLPGIPTAKSMQSEGVGISDLQTKLLQKIEELTLYVIDLSKRNKAQEDKINELELKVQKKY